MKLLVTTYMVDEYKEVFEKMFDEVHYKGMMELGRLLTEDELAEALQGMDAVFIEFDPLSRKVLEQAKDLKIILSVRGGAHANIDVEAATEMGIPITNVPGRNGDTVADFTIGMMIAVSRGLAQGNHLIKNKVMTDEKQHFENGFCKNDINWVGSTPEKFAYLQYKGPTLAGKTLGLVGCGAIGMEVAKRAEAFDMEVIAFDPYLKPENIKYGIKLMELEDVMRQADFVSIHVPVTPSTRGLVSAEMLSLMKPNAYLINNARAAVLDYDKLIDMLQKNEIAGAALDVYPIEPLPDNHPLVAMDNVVLTPHIAGCSLDPYVRSYKKLAVDAQRFLAGERPEKVYNPDVYKD